MKETSLQCHECKHLDSSLFYISQTDEYYCEICNKIFKKEEIIDCSWAEAELEKIHIDKQMDNIVEESINNLLHEVKMEKVFENKAKKQEDEEIMTKTDKLLNEIFAMA